MHQIMRAGVVIVAASMLIACGGSPGKVSKRDLQDVRAAYNQVALGMTESEVASLLRKGSYERLSSGTVDGMAVEEYKLEAYYDDDWNKTRDLQIAFFYFADDRLVSISDSRIQYRAKPEIVAQWRKGVMRSGSGAVMEDER